MASGMHTCGLCIYGLNDPTQVGLSTLKYYNTIGTSPPWFHKFYCMHFLCRKALVINIFAL